MELLSLCPPLYIIIFYVNYSNPFNSLRQVPPYSVEFFMKYIEIEKCATEINESIITGAYEDAILHFGKNNKGKHTIIFTLINSFI